MATMKATNLWCLTAIAIAAVASGIGLRSTLTPVPVSMVDVRDIAHANGLWTIACDGEAVDESATCRKMIVSRRPWNDRELDLLMTADPESPLWRGCVSVIQLRPGIGIRHLSPAPQEVVVNFGDVGDILLCGDRELVKALKGWIASSRERPKKL
jgi:hypothetical protein